MSKDKFDKMLKNERVRCSLSGIFYILTLITFCKFMVLGDVLGVVSTGFLCMIFSESGRTPLNDLAKFMKPNYEYFDDKK